MPQLHFITVAEKFITFMDKSIEPFHDLASAKIDYIFEQYEEMTDSLPCCALSPVTKLAKSIQNLASYIIEQISKEKPFAFSLSDTTVSLLCFPLETAVNIKTIMSFIKLRNLKKKFIKNIGSCTTTFSERNMGAFKNSVLKVINTVSQIFDAPGTVSKFLKIFKISLPKIFEQPILFANIFAFMLQPAKIWIQIKAYRSLCDLQEELNHAKYVGFLEAYSKTNEIPKLEKNIHLLSIRTLKSTVDLAKSHLKKKNDIRTLENVKHVANIHFVITLNEKIKAQPEVVKKIFRIRFENKQLLDPTQKAKFGENFFDDLVTERFLKPSNHEKLNRAVKVLNSRLNLRAATYLFTIITKSISWTSSLFGQFETFGISVNPISPIKLVVEASLASASFFNFFYQIKKKEEFVAEMEALTGRSKRPDLNHAIL